MKLSRRIDLRVCPSRRELLVVVLITGLLSCAPGRIRAGDTLPAASEVTRRMIERSQTLAQADQGPQYTYQNRSLVERLDADGHVLKTEDKLYRVTLIGGFPFRRLTKVQGRELTPEELSREEAREQAFRQKFVSMDLKKPGALKEGLVTAELLERYHFEVEKRVMLNNRPTLVLTFKPKEGPHPAKKIEDRLLNPMAGRVWIDEADADTARLESRLTEPVSLGWFGWLGSLTQCEVSLERQRMPDGVWVNTKQALLIQCRKLVTTMRFRSTDTSSGFSKQGPPPGPVTRK